MTDRFDEQTLLSAVIAKWGPFGAHADVLRHLIRTAGTVTELQTRITNLTAELTNLHAQLKDHT